MAERNVAVVGGGAAGLAAALQLAGAGARVTLYERAHRPGGKLRTEVIDGARVDAGVQMVSTTHTSLIDLLRDCNANGLLKRSPGHDALWRNGRPQGITYGSVASMATSGALPAGLKLKMVGRYLPYLTTQARGLDTNDPARTGGAARDQESIGAWGRRELGDDFVELLVYPLLAAYYGATPDETSAEVYHALARAGMDVSVIAATAGFGGVADAFARAFEQRGGRIVTDADIQRVAVTAQGVEIEANAKGGAHDAAVIAVPANRVMSLIDVPSLADWFAAIRVRRAFTVAYRVDREFPGDYFGLSFPRATPMGEQIAAVCVQSRKLPGLVPSGDALVVLPAPTVLDTWYDRPDDDIASALLDTLERAVRGVAARVTSTHVFRFEDGYTLFEPGHLRRIAAFDPARLPPQLALAGEYLVAPSVEGAVRSGMRAAERVMR